ncbi:mannosyl-oligosaccharide 1,2-alpha-mannosidase [Martiniozyma asiatica (nom. inval.)]|nr:mannosyl-oligosaccharide 1,2-alpha-mannosidase [Martiniozyma asiatica]
MSSFRPKTWNKKSSPGLPQYYKDKLPSNNYSNNTKLNFTLTPHKRKLLTRFLVGSFIFYFIWYLFAGGNDSASPRIWKSRKDAVRTVFQESWKDYDNHGWGKDIYHPVSQKGKNMQADPMGWIIVDSLDTLQLMGLKEELAQAKQWVANELDYDQNHYVNTFETTIRMLGGLLSAYYLTEDDIYAEKAVQLGNRLLSAFDSSLGLPASEINLKTGMASYSAQGISTAEAGSLQLEFKYLANITGESQFWSKAEKVLSIIDSDNKGRDGLVPIFMDSNKGLFNSELIRLGSRGDSYYEYLLKQYLQTDEKIYHEMYLESFEGIKKHLVSYSKPNNYLFLGELEKGIDGPLSYKMDHLVCFIGGLFALGATEGLTLKEAEKMSWFDKSHREQLKFGEEMAKTCYHMYHDTPGTGLSPEIVIFNTQEDKSSAPKSATWSSDGDFFIKHNDLHNLQRPETVETLYYLYKITGDNKYREWGWEIFENFVKWTSVGNGNQKRYTVLKNVSKKSDARFDDNMESFWLAETLKYLYLLFDDENNEKWSLKDIIFNTEAHPLPKMGLGRFETGWSRNGGSAKDGASKGGIALKGNTVERVQEEESIVNDKHIEETTDKIKEKLKEDDGNSDFEEFDSTNPYDEFKKHGGFEKKKTDSGKKDQELVDFNFDDDSTKLNSDLDSDPQLSKEKALDKSKEVAEKIKAKGEQPQAKGSVAKPLNEQAIEAKQEELEDARKIENDDTIINKLEEELSL